MKGQYLAIETMLTFGMGIALAIGTISVFENYRTQVIDSTTDKEITIVQSELQNAIFDLKSADSGNIEVELPDDISGSEYSISLDEGIRVSVNRRTYEKDLNNLNQRYDFQGTVDGGNVQIYKQENRFLLRSG